MGVFYLKRGDTRPILEVALKNPDGSAYDVSGATVNLHVLLPGGVFTRAMTIFSGTAGLVRYTWADADWSTLSNGIFPMEYEVAPAAGGLVTFPNDRNDRLLVTVDLDSMGGAPPDLSTGAVLLEAGGSNAKISALADGTPALSTDQLVVARSGANRRLTVADLLALPPTFPLLAPDGSASAPSYSFASDTDTGIYHDPTFGTPTLPLIGVVGGQKRMMLGRDRFIIGWDGLDPGVAAPSTSNIRALSGAGTDVNGGGLVLSTGQSTGLGNSSSILLQVSPPGSASGSSFNPFQTALSITSINGGIVLGGLDIVGAPQTATFKGADRAVGVTDGSGGLVQVQGGQSTGSAAGGGIIFQVTPPSSSGTAQNSYANILTLSGSDGTTTLGGLDIIGTPGASTWAGADRAAGVTDGTGGAVTIRGGQSTGSAAGGNIGIEVSPPGSSGTVQNPLVQAIGITASNGAIGLGGIDVIGSPGAVNLFGADRATGVTDGSGGVLTLRGGQGTGTGLGGNVTVQVVPPASGSGTSQNAAQSIAVFQATGTVALGNTNIVSPGNSSWFGANRATGQTDGTGGPITIGGGKGTGTAAGGSIFLQVAPGGSASGSSQNGLQSSLIASGSGGSVDIGGVDVQSPSNSSWSGADRASGVTNGTGGLLQIQGGQGTGSAAGGSIQFRVAPPGSSGTAQNSYADILLLSGSDGATTLGGLDIIGTPGDSTWAGADRAAGVTDGSGGSVTIRGGQSTGTGAEGNVKIQLSPPAASTATTQNALRDVENWDVSSIADPQSTTITMTGSVGGTMKRVSTSELLTLSTVGATTDTTNNLLPADAIILAVNTRVQTTISGGGVTTFSVGDPTTTARFSASAGGLTAGSARIGLQHQQGSVTTDAAGPVQTSAAKVRITCNGTPTQGAVRIQVWALVFTAPTS